MKNIFKLLIILTSLIFITGCDDYNLEMTLKKDKSIYINFMITNGSLVEEAKNENNFDTLKEIFENRGYTVNRTTLEPFERLEISKHISNIDKISVKEKTTVDITNFMNRYFDDQAIFEKERGLFKNNYKASFIYDPLSVEELDINSSPNTFTLNLPHKAVSSNATSINNNTYIWIIDPNNKTEINFVISYQNNLIKYLIAIIFVSIICITTSLSLKKKLRKQSK